MGDIIGVSVSGDMLTLEVENGSATHDILQLHVLGEHIFKVDYRPHGIEPSQQTPMIDPDKTWEAVGANIDVSGNPIIITTSKMRVEIERYPCRMTIKNSDGIPLLWETESGGVFRDGVRFVRSSQDNLYGIRGYSAFEDAGNILRNDSNHPSHAGEQGDAGGPFIWSTAGYGILVDSDGGYPFTETSTGKLEFYYGGTPEEGRRYVKENVEFYVMLGKPKEIMHAYTEITGKPPLLPKWSLGFMNFEWDIDQAELESIVETYRAKNIPLDAFALDYDWMSYGEDNYGEFLWNVNNFPDAADSTLKSKMDQRGLKLIGIRKPRIVTKDKNGQRTTQFYDAEAGGYWYPGHEEYTDYFIPVTVRSIDPYKQEMRDWWWNHSKEAYDKGIRGWWNDETDKVSSGAAQYWFGNFTTTHLSQAMYEGQRAYTDNKERIWQTARNYYPGAQRYATTLWSGDIAIQYYKGEKVEWAAGMQEQPSVMLSAVNLGQFKWGMDAGGFNMQNGTIDNPSPELYTRWLQFGALTPVFRVHGNYQQQRQPWYYGMTAEEVTKAAIHFRYRLLPYMYTYERSAYESGVGLVRPLIFDYPDDEQVKNTTDSWMFGDWLLVAPVLEKGQTSKQIYLPEGTWIDYFRGHVYNGNQSIHYPLDAESWTDIPIFVKQGAIIPSQEVQDYVGQKSAEMMTIDVFAGDSESRFTYYDDDGNTYGYETGDFFKQEMTAQDQGTNGIRFTVQAKEGQYTPETEYYLVRLHGKAGERVTLNGSSLTYYDQLFDLKNASGEGWAKGREIYGDVTYVKVRANSSSVKELIVTGDAPVSTDHLKYEAEEASLSGETTNSRASVNNNHSGYSGQGFVDGFHHEEAAATFYVSTKTGGDYDISLRYANGTGTDQTLSIYVNGKRVTQTVLADTGDWSTWGIQTETLPLTAGQNMITYRYDAEAGDTGNVNLDYITVPFEPAQAEYLAESAKLDGGASTNQNHWFYTGNAFVDGMTQTGASVQFLVDVPATGEYQVALRYANGTNSTRTISVYVNGNKVEQIKLTSPGMNWNLWREHVHSVTLQKGTNTIMYRYDSSDSGNVNLDRIIVSAETPVQPVSEKNLLDNSGFERPTDYSSNWTQWHPGGQPSAFGVDSGSGINPPESPWTGDQRAYFWSANAYKQSIHQTVEVPVNNAHYKLEARVRLLNTNPYVARAEIMDYGGQTIYYDLENNGRWSYLTVDNIYVTSGQIKVGFYVDSPGGTTLHIDDVRVTIQE
ncbi:alpha-glucosidase (family GH31 glycosyl hydrolase) [Caldalkalibacillus uzonensis]|uniref:Alpha-glucosidase (Family GH31 glycosyl hydrolase) n=1 Tax=Caldalkalibacillus uzonensis TaxID=353224 RepID=A0ABU0CPX0_9BACI|nr:alpha-glucosidase (family GH31 glycosyl hydrolase) [Caldalkalibacillus uzonensis]